MNFHTVILHLVLLCRDWGCRGQRHPLSFQKMTCGGLNENGPYRLICLKTLSCFVGCLGRLGVWPCMQVCQWGWALNFKRFTPFPSLWVKFPACRLGHDLSDIALVPCRCACCYAPHHDSDGLCPSGIVSPKCTLHYYKSEDLDCSKSKSWHTCCLWKCQCKMLHIDRLSPFLKWENLQY